MRVVSVIMPRQGQSVESCVITKWHKKVGETVSAGELLFSYETDKAAFDEEAKVNGIVLAILGQEGDDVPCLEPVCVIGAAGETVGTLQEEVVASSPVDETFQAIADHLLTASQAFADVGLAKEAPAGEPQKISPRARALAEKSGVDVSLVTASGPEGRVIARDVQALIDTGRVVTKAAWGVVSPAAQGTGLGSRVSVYDQVQVPSTPSVQAGETILEEPVSAVQRVAQGGQKDPVVQDVPSVSIASSAQIGFAPSYRDEPLPNIRKRIAKTMLESLSTMAQLTHTVTYDATNIVALRKQFKEQGKAYGMDGVTLGDLIVFGVVRTLTRPAHAHLNAHFLGDAIRYFEDVHLGVAIDTPRGLMVPTVRFANQMTLLALSNEIKALSAACRTGAIDPDLLSGAGFTVSNLGAFEIEHFTPIINPPQTGVLGVNTIQQRVREKEGQIEVYPAMSLSLTYDHRALDGAPASAFLRDLKRNLENIQMLLGGGVYHV